MKKKPKTTDRATLYAFSVVSGEVQAGPYIRGACQRHLDDLEHAGDRGFYFDEHQAAEAIAFFEECLCLNGGQYEGLPFILFDWENFIIGSLFGWLRKSDNMRRFRVAYVEGPKGFGKSPLSAGIGLKGMLADNEARAEIYAAATKKEQAMVLFRDAVAMYEMSPEINKRLVASGVGEKCWNLSHMASGSFFRVISSEKKGQSGARPHMALLDEIHEHSDGTMVEMLRAGFKFRRQPLSFMITNPLAIDTPIATPDGWSTMGELIIGDQVFNEVGIPCIVTAVSTAMNSKKCYRVIFDDGSEIVCDADHLWKTTIKHPFGSREKHSQSMVSPHEIGKKRKINTDKNRLIKCQCGCGKEFFLYDCAGRPRNFVSGHNSTKSQNTKVRTTQEIKETLHFGENGSNHKIELAGPLQLPEKKLPIPPYVLGCWLGDGNSKDSAIVVTSEDLEILENIKKEGVTVGDRRAVSSSGPNLGLYGLGITGTYNRNSMQSKLRALGVLKNKHIPQVYLRASFEQRLSLLQGLMDTDGSIIPWSGRCVFTQSKYNLILQTAELINGLGIKCRVRHDISRLNGKSFDRWDIFFLPPWDIPVFKLTRKLKHHRSRSNRRRPTGHRWIKNIIPVPSVPVRCITVDSESHLYLAGESMIPTHNSGHDKTSICWEYHDMGLKIALQQIQNDEFFSYICSLDEEDMVDDRHLEDESLWAKVNPSLRYGLPGYDYIRGQVLEARGMPSKMATVKRLCFCQWTEADNPWISYEVWMGCRDLDFNQDLLRGRRCHGGLDLSAIKDLTSFQLVFDPTEEDPFYRLLSFFWMPSDGLHKRVETDHVPYDIWKAQGHLFTTPGKSISKGAVVKFINEEIQKYELAGIAYDRDRMTDLIEFADKAGIELNIGKWDKEKRVWKFEGDDGIKMMPFGQSPRSMAPAVDKFEVLMTNQEIKHNGNPVMTWCAANAVAIADENNYRKVSKQKSTGRVDGIVAAVMACGILEEGPVESAYKGMTSDEIKNRMIM